MHREHAFPGRQDHFAFYNVVTESHARSTFEDPACPILQSMYCSVSRPQNQLNSSTSIFAAKSKISAVLQGVVKRASDSPAR